MTKARILLAGMVLAAVTLPGAPAWAAQCTGFVAVAAGPPGEHSLALDGSGAVWAWGWNAFGQLGDGTFTDHHAPAPVSGLPVVGGVSAGGDHNLAIGSGGVVWAWGGNYAGQLGNGTTFSKNKPIQVSGLSGIVQVAAGGSHSLALDSAGVVWAWGWNWYGQLGDGTTTNKLLPVMVPGLTDVTMIAAGGDSSFAVHSNGTVVAWGANGLGQLGSGVVTNHESSPVSVLAMTSPAAIAAGQYHTMMTSPAINLWSWGSNGHGQLGNGTITNTGTPVPGPTLGLPIIRQLDAGWFHSIALRTNLTTQEIWTWGSNLYGQLGDGTTVDNGAPQLVPVSGATSVAAGANHSLAVGQNGSLWAWGRNQKGQIGDGTTTTRTSPVQLNC